MFAQIRQRLVDARSARLRATVTQDAARLRAARGAAFLDGVAPGWASTVDLQTLRLGDGTSCVLGQLHGDYRVGLGRAGVLDLSSAPLASLSPVDLGFQAVAGLGDGVEDLDYAFLTRAWRELVRLRQAPAGGPGERPAALSLRARARG